MVSLGRQITRAKESLRAAKPKSRRRIELEIRLRDLRLRQLRREIERKSR